MNISADIIKLRIDIDEVLELCKGLSVNTNSLEKQAKDIHSTALLKREERLKKDRESFKKRYYENREHVLAIQKKSKEKHKQEYAIKARERAKIRRQRLKELKAKTEKEANKNQT